MHSHNRGRVQSFLGVLDSLLKRKVVIRLLNTKELGASFRRSFDKFPMLWDGMERQLYPRVHFKHIIIGGKFAYSGSANFTEAGLCIESPNNRNFKSGFIQADQAIVQAIMNQFDEVWLAKFCK